MFNPKPITTRAYVNGQAGEYSTIILPNGVVETCWFPNEGDSRVIERTVISIRDIHSTHIDSHQREA